MPLKKLLEELFPVLAESELREIKAFARLRSVPCLFIGKLKMVSATFNNERRPGKRTEASSHKWNVTYGSNDRLISKIIPMGGSARLPARQQLEWKEKIDLIYPKRLHGLRQTGFSPLNIPPRAPVTNIPWLRAIPKQAQQGQRAWDPKKESFFQNTKRPDSAISVENGLRDQLITNSFYTMPQLMPPLIIGYLLWLWEQSAAG